MRILSLLLLAFALGAGLQVLQPLAIVGDGGLILSIVLSLIVTPALYYQSTAQHERRENLAAAQAVA